MALDKPLEGEVVEVVPDRSLAEWTPKFVVTVDEAVARRDERIDYMKRVLIEGVHYGVVPGTGNKPALFKPGAESLCADFGLRPDPINDGVPILDFDGRDHNSEPFIYYQRKVNLYRLHPQTGERVWVGAGSGSCTSWEDKYRWRQSVRQCPECGKAAIIKGKAEYGGGWICFRKKDGCGAKFPDNAVSITSQQAGRIANDRIADLANTILKMADKRALVAAVLNTTGVSDLFTQDLEESGETDEEERARVEASRSASAPKSNAVSDDELRARAQREAEKPAPTLSAEPPANDRALRSEVITLFNRHSKEAQAFLKEHKFPNAVASMTREQAVELREFLMSIPVLIP